MLNKREKMKKIDSYEPCPCGSGEKFKFCCYQKSRMAKKPDFSDYTESRIQHMINASWKESDFQTCLAFDKTECESLIKSAHALQNNRILNRVSEKGHVYTFSSEVTGGRPEANLKKVSKNKASTFFGFCDIHDTELFKPVELKDYEGSPIQNFLLSFRGFCLEYHRKIRKLYNARRIFKNYPSTLHDPSAIHLYRIAEFDVNDSKEEYNLFKEMYQNNNYDSLHTMYRKLNFEVDFAVSSSFAVKDDLYGNLIVDIYSSDPEEQVPNIYLNIYPTPEGTNIIISYNKEYRKNYGRYFEQLENLTNSQLQMYLNFLIINYTENVFFSPRFIENITPSEKKSLLKSFQSSIVIEDKIDLIIAENYFEFNLFNNSAN